MRLSVTIFNNLWSSDLCDQVTYYITAYDQVAYVIKWLMWSGGLLFVQIYYSDMIFLYTLLA